MKSLLNSLKTALRDHSRYMATRHEIESMPLDVALDLGIFREDAHLIAKKAVWG